MKSFYFRHFSASRSVVPATALALLCFTGVARAADYTTDSECYKIRNTMPASLNQGQMLYAALVMSSCQKCAAKSQIFHYQYTDKSTDTGTCDTKRAAPNPNPNPTPAPAPNPTPGATTPFNSAWKSSEFVELVLTQTGTYVIGKYNAADNGLMFGTVVGTTFHGFWVENSSSVACKTKMDGRDYWGRVHLTVSGKTLTGMWGYCDAEPSGAASATR